MIILHLRWQYNQMRYSGMFSFSGKGKVARTSQREEHWKSQTKEHGDGRVTKRINVEDLWNPNTAKMLNSLKG